MFGTENPYSAGNLDALTDDPLNGPIVNPKVSVRIELTHAEYKKWQRYLLVSQQTEKAAVTRLVKGLLKGMSK